jgi:hypothetical protein
MRKDAQPSKVPQAARVHNTTVADSGWRRAEKQKTPTNYLSAVVAELVRKGGVESLGLEPASAKTLTSAASRSRSTPLLRRRRTLLA